MTRLKRGGSGELALLRYAAKLFQTAWLVRLRRRRDRALRVCLPARVAGERLLPAALPPTSPAAASHPPPYSPLMCGGFPLPGGVRFFPCVWGAWWGP